MHHYNSILVPYEPHSCLLTSSLGLAPLKKASRKTPLFASRYKSFKSSGFMQVWCKKEAAPRYDCPHVCHGTKDVANIFWVSPAGDGLKGGEL